MLRLFTGLSTGRALANLEQLVLSLGHRVDALANDVNRTSAAALRAELDTVTGLLEQLRTANRREFGKLWYSLRGSSPAGGRVDAAIPDDAELRALIDLQNGNGPRGT